MQSNLVLLHGWGMNKAVWQLVQQDLQSAGYNQVLALDLPGFGNAPWLQAEYDLTTAVTELAAHIPEQSTLVAWSMAGLFALHLAQAYPNKVRKIILVGSSPYFLESPQWPGIKALVLAQFQAALLQDTGKTIERFLAIQAMGSEHAKQDIKRLREWLATSPTPNTVALAGGLTLLADCDLRALFCALPIPIYGIFGRLDSLVPERAVAAMQQLNPAFRAEILPKASHAPFISHREEFVSILKSML
ncbi:pimeloyl-ACP methyl ester esterase BioH [Pseudoalteromonas fenneropenaei]|uniref:Pimeloyl-[acyl-carrier protein] methyl ester esterase n=1 Tax=Pseudoalteromonas fenneropenaei TaxID=1737459 RepID=A0ABV7CQ82_9GAMM